jgi:hypothetical protein
MDPTRATDLLQSIAAVIAAARLIYLGLGKQFPALFSYFVFVATLECAWGAMDRFSKLYFWTYVAIEPLEYIFSILVVRELLTVMFDNYPGIRTVGRWAMYAALAMSAGASLALTKFLWNAGAKGRHKWGIFYFEITQRSVVFSLVVVIIVILFVLSKYPLHLGRNTYVSCIAFSALFLSEAARLLLDSTARVLHIDFVDWTESIFIALCLGTWAFMLQPAAVPVVRVAFSTPQEDHLLQQLDSLNQLMSRAAKR